MNSGLAILGATGSVGRSTLDVLARQPSTVPLYALTAHRNAAALAELCRAHRPRAVSYTHLTLPTILRV